MKLTKIATLFLVALFLIASAIPTMAASKMALSVVAATANDGNVPANVLDGSLSTRFSSNNDGAYIILGASNTFTLETVKIAWHNGSTREFYFEIFASTDNVNYTKVYPASGNASSSGDTTSLETYDVTNMTAKYIKVVGHENSYNSWFSPTEIEAWGTAGGGSTPTPTVTPTATPTATVSPAPSASTLPGVNLALQRPVTYSSQQTGNEATRVVDGSTSTRWSADTYPEWVCVDLGAVYSINKTEVAPYSNRSYQYKVEVSTTSSTSGFTQVVDRTNNTTTGSVLSDTFTPVNARYVRLTVTGCDNYTGTWSSINEFRVFGGGGTPSASPSPTVSASVQPTPTKTPTPSVVPTSTPTPTPTSGGGTIHNVSSTSQWSTAVTNAQPGDTIRITANLSSGISIKNKVASESNPIYIVAANPQVTTLYSLTVDNCQGIVVQGFKFGPNTAGVLMKVVNSKYVKILRNYFDHNNISTSQSTIVTTQASQYIEVGYNTFDRKNVGTVSGSYIKTQYDAPNITKNMHIHHNYFNKIVPMPSGGTFDGDSDREAIVLGISSSQDIMTDHIIEYNLFEDCDGENEIITVKTSRNIIRYNTFKNCLGSVSVRFGTQTEVYGNFFFGSGASGSMSDPNYETGGIRIYGSYHKIYNNYMENLTGTSYRVPLCIDGGDTSDSSGGDSHERPTNCQVVNNTIVNCAWGIDVGTHYSMSPQNNKIANNIITGSQNKLFNLGLCDATNTFEGNIAWPTGSATVGVSKSQNEIWTVDPKLTTVDGLKKLSSTSPAINYAKGSYSFVTTDMDGQTRTTNDAGADEYSAASITIRPMTTATAGYSAP